MYFSTKNSFWEWLEGHVFLTIHFLCLLKRCSQVLTKEEQRKYLGIWWFFRACILNQEFMDRLQRAQEIPENVCKTLHSCGCVFLGEETHIWVPNMTSTKQPDCYLNGVPNCAHVTVPILDWSSWVWESPRTRENQGGWSY